MPDRVAVLGERILAEGWALAGARVLAAETPTEVRAAWAALPTDVAVVLLTPARRPRSVRYRPTGSGR